VPGVFQLRPLKSSFNSQIQFNRFLTFFTCSLKNRFNNNFLEVFFIIQEDSKAGGQEDRRNP